MEVNKFKDFKKLSVYDSQTDVWFVGVPIIEKGEFAYQMDCPLIKGRLEDVGLNTIMFEEIFKHGLPDDERFREFFHICENDTNDLKGRKIFTTEREAIKYHNSIRKTYQSKVDELNSKYVIKLSDICEKMGIPKEECKKVIILKYN